VGLKSATDIPGAALTETWSDPEQERNLAPDAAYAELIERFRLSVDSMAELAQHDHTSN
jgi:hypothetical protein